MVLIFNGETAGGFRLARRSSIKDGLFDCILLEKKNFFRSTMAMCRYLAGGNPKIVRHLRARTIDIRSTIDEPTDVDGQKGAGFPLHIECIAEVCASCAQNSNKESLRAEGSEGFVEIFFRLFWGRCCDFGPFLLLLSENYDDMADIGKTTRGGGRETCGKSPSPGSKRR